MDNWNADLFPMLRVGNLNDAKKVRYLLHEIYPRDDIQVYEMNAGEYWLNLDYTSKHAGGPIMPNIGRVVYTEEP